MWTLPENRNQERGLSSHCIRCYVALRFCWVIVLYKLKLWERLVMHLSDFLGFVRVDHQQEEGISILPRHSILPLSLITSYKVWRQDPFY